MLPLLQGIYLLHFIPRLIGVFIFSGYDTKCALYENASIFDCTQEFIVAGPKEWILFWLVMSISSSIILYFICSAHKRVKIWTTCNNVSFWNRMILFLFTLVSFFMRIININWQDRDALLFLALPAWLVSTAWQIIYVNNINFTYNTTCSSCIGKS